tara:strand:- start:2519 stop:2701 length:183 start_codon:yes stop_codon:yes gene_type:complete
MIKQPIQNNLTSVKKWVAINTNKSSGIIKVEVFYSEPNIEIIGNSNIITYKEAVQRGFKF